MRKSIFSLLILFCLVIISGECFAEEEKKTEDEETIIRALSYDGSILNNEGNISLTDKDKELFEETFLFGYKGYFAFSSIDEITVDNIIWINSEDYSDSLFKNYARGLCTIYGSKYITETEEGMDTFSWESESYTVFLRHRINNDSVTVEWLDDADIINAGYMDDASDNIVINKQSLIDKSELLNVNGVTVTIEKAFYDSRFNWYDFQFKVNNMSTESLFVKLNHMTINKFQIDTYINDPYPMVESGNIGICDTYVLIQDFENDNIGDVFEIECDLDLLDGDRHVKAFVPVIIKGEIFGYSKGVIQKVQEMLNMKGYDCGIPDGILGGHTSSAISNYQAAAGLNVSGTVDAELIDSLGLNK